jgi:hypothetical protein
MRRIFSGNTHYYSVKNVIPPTLQKAQDYFYQLWTVTSGVERSGSTALACVSCMGLKRGICL